MFQHTAGEKGSQASSTASREQHDRAGEDYAAGIMISVSRASLRDLALQAGKGEGRERGECVRFRHLRYLIKKTADSISSALQIPLLQEQQPWKTPSPVSSAWKIPKAAKPGSVWEGRTLPAGFRALPPSSNPPGNTGQQWEHSSGVETQQIQLEMTSPDSAAFPALAPVPQESDLLFKEEFTLQCNLS